MTDENQYRRRSTDREISQIDKRLGFIERDVETIGKDQLPALVKKVDDLRDAMGEPESSPGGRALIQRAATNAANIGKLESEVDALRSWQSEMIGAAKLARLVQLLLGIVVALLTLAQVSKA